MTVTGYIANNFTFLSIHNEIKILTCKTYSGEV